MSISSSTKVGGDTVTASNNNDQRKDVLVHAADFLTDSGSANAYVVTVDNQITSLVAGQVVKLNVSNANTGASTLRFKNSLALDTTKSIKRADGSALVAFDVYGLVVLLYDGTDFRLISGGQVKNIKAKIVAGETFTVSGNPIPAHFSDGTNGRTAGRVYISDVDDATNRTQKFDGFVKTTVSSGGDGYLITDGLIDGFTGLSAGVTYYLSSTAGEITTTNTGIRVGIAVSSTEILISKQDVRVKIGVDSWSPTAVNQTKTITHNLGKKPKMVKVTFWDATVPEDSFGFGMYDGSNYATLYVAKNANPGNDSFTDTSHIIVKDRQTSGSTGWSATVTTFGEDTVIFTCDAYAATENMNFSWEVYA